MNKLILTRVFTFLLAWYVLFLTMTPCVDKELNCSKSQHLYAGQAATDRHTDHHDACSPFCTCSCCNLAMEVTAPYMIAIESFLPQKLIFSFDPRLISFFSYTIWEPPKS